MIHGMLCTLMIGTVLPEPELAKFWIEVELYEWNAVGQDNSLLVDSLPAHSRSLGRKRLPIEQSGVNRNAGIEMGGSAIIIKAIEQSSDRFVLRVTAFYEDDDWRGSLGYVKTFELEPGEERLQSPHRHGNRILAFIVRLHRVK